MPNRLADEPSPYLRQHAHNPVDWYPWGPEALARAAAEDRPILLSIGYSACHWCHVMEHESFDDPETARVMNDHFVSVKVDREERPDLDGVYMKAVQSLTGRGGWPLTAFLTPEGEPFYGGTYYPPEPRQGMPSFRQVLAAVHEAWTERREQVMEGAAELRQAVAGQMAGADVGADEGGVEVPGEALLRAAVQRLRERFDPVHGGFGGAPKFPQPVTLEFLLGRHAATGDTTPLELVVHTLRKVAAGGVRDHVGGGFHRYSVDARWRVPHFEKMLYDNALLARVYVDAWQASGVEDFARVARETLDWILDDLQTPEGGFQSARDADSEGEEGRFYLWTPEEVARVGAAAGIGDETVARFCRVHDVRPGGNFEGRSILHLPEGFDAAARREEMEPEALRAELAPLKAALREARATREPPLLDDKVLCAWSAFAVRALAEAGRILGEGRYLEAARRGAAFLVDEVRVEGRLHRAWSEGAPRIAAFLEDHAALGNALLTLYEADLEARWLAEVRWCVEEILARFHDPDTDLLFDTPTDGEPLVVRPRDVPDTATPSGTSLAVELLLRAGHLFGEVEWSALARRTLAREAPLVARFPGGFGRLLRQVERSAAAPVEVAILGPAGSRARTGLVDAAWRERHPNRTVAGGDPETQRALLDAVPLLRGRGTVDGAAAAWICRDHACRAPVTDPDDVTLADV